MRSKTPDTTAPAADSVDPPPDMYPPREGSRYTATEQRIMKLLSDGMPHHWKELLACCWDELTERGSVKVHLHQIRRKLPPGHAVVTEMHRGGAIHYRHVLLLPRRSSE